MTIHASIIHRFVPPGSRMTESTIPGNISMRGDAAKHISVYGIQGAGAEHASAAREGKSCDGKRRDQAGDDTGPCKTSQSSCSHFLL